MPGAHGPEPRPRPRPEALALTPPQPPPLPHPGPAPGQRPWLRPHRTSAPPLPHPGPDRPPAPPRPEPHPPALALVQAPPRPHPGPAPRLPGPLRERAQAWAAAAGRCLQSVCARARAWAAEGLGRASCLLGPLWGREGVRAVGAVSVSGVRAVWPPTGPSCVPAGGGDEEARGAFLLNPLPFAR